MREDRFGSSRIFSKRTTYWMLLQDAGGKTADFTLIDAGKRAVLQAGGEFYADIAFLHI